MTDKEDAEKWNSFVNGNSIIKNHYLIVERLKKRIEETKTRSVSDDEIICEELQKILGEK